MRAYIVQVRTKDFSGAARVSQEGYKTLAAAKAFITGRGGKIMGDCQYCYEDGFYYYEIYEVDIKE